MAGDPARDEELLPVREIRDAFCRRRGIGPGPCRKLVDEIVSREDEFLWCDLACRAEGGGVRDGSEAIPPGAERGMEDVHRVEPDSRGYWMGRISGIKRYSSPNR